MSRLSMSTLLLHCVRCIGLKILKKSAIKNLRILQNCLLFHNFGCTMGPATNFLEERVVTTKACTAFPVMLARHIIPHLPPQQKNFVKDRKKTQHVCVIFRKQPVTSSLRIKGSMCYTYNMFVSQTFIIGDQGKSSD